jgi:competence protein ComEC
MILCGVGLCGVGVIASLNQFYRVDHLASKLIKTSPICIEGTVKTLPTWDHKKFSFDLADLEIYPWFQENSYVNKPTLVDGKIKITFWGHKPNIGFGDRIRLIAKVKTVGWGGYPILVGHPISSRSYVVIDRDGGNSVHSFIALIRSRIREDLETNFDKGHSTLLRALLIGDRTGISKEDRLGWSRLGIAHLLAISGLHVGMVFIILFWLFKFFLSLFPPILVRFEARKLAMILSLPVLFIYTMIAGAQISTIRAMVMISVYVISRFFGRRSFTFDTLWFAMLLILLFDPLALFSISFQLSCSAVFGILYLCPLSRSALTVSIAAYLFTLPLISHYFGQISYVAVFANLAFVPFVGFGVLPLSILTAFCLLLNMPSNALVIVLNWLLEFLSAIISRISQFPFISSEWSMSWLQVISIYGVLLLVGLVLSKKGRILSFISQKRLGFKLNN